MSTDSVNFAVAKGCSFSALNTHVTRNFQPRAQLHRQVAQQQFRPVPEHQTSEVGVQQGAHHRSRVASVAQRVGHPGPVAERRQDGAERTAQIADPPEPERKPGGRGHAAAGQRRRTADAAAQGLRPESVPGAGHHAQPGHPGRVRELRHRGPGPGPAGRHVPPGPAQHHGRQQAVPARPAGRPLPVPARRPVDRNAQGGPVRSGPSRPVPGTGGRGRRGRRPRRPEQRRVRPGPGTGAGRVQGVHGRVGTPEHAVLGHRFRSGDRRGPDGRSVRVHAPPPEETPSSRRRSRRQVAGRQSPPSSDVKSAANNDSAGHKTEPAALLSSAA
ncbi:hypothetical protein AGLY_008344 [Aphis glycines]|uniref:Uncharacterized protein n=1 Tax=Aphis glycines TaxID=307491 RepID=A0A6G0TLK1_APHGL|nr:hypothetical protein AGLY_008344 [Aphis glycines]